ncbi:MAG: DUF4430 domain-containing protein [Acholeplasmataceae bacterium]
MSKFKKVLSVVVLAFVLFLAVGCDKKPEKGEMVEVVVIVESKDEELSNKTHQIEEFSSVFELLQKYYTITFTRSSFGPYLNTLKAANKVIGEEEGYYIALYINDEYAQVGIGAYYVNKGDTFKFVEEAITW